MYSIPAYFSILFVLSWSIEERLIILFLSHSHRLSNIDEVVQLLSEEGGGEEWQSNVVCSRRIQKEKNEYDNPLEHVQGHRLISTQDENMSRNVFNSLIFLLRIHHSFIQIYERQ